MPTGPRSSLGALRSTFHSQFSARCRDCGVDRLPRPTRMHGTSGRGGRPRPCAPLVAALSLWLFPTCSGGTWRLEILASVTVERLLGLVLLWHLAMKVATFALRRR